MDAIALTEQAAQERFNKRDEKNVGYGSRRGLATPPTEEEVKAALAELEHSGIIK